VTILIVAAFAQAFWQLGPPRSLSDDGTYLPVVDCSSDLSDEDYYDNGGWMCRITDSYFHSFSMVFTNDLSFLHRATGAHSVLMTIFAFTIGILLLNIIIGLISSVFEDVEKNGQRAFWLKRLRFINELQSFLNVVLRRFLSKKQLGNPVDENKHDADELYNAGEVEETTEDKKSNPINLERISLTRGKSIGNWGQIDGKEKDFISWYKGDSEVGTPAPPLLWRLMAFLKIAKWHEIYFPSMAFRKVLVGVPQETDIEGFHKKLLGWIGSRMLCLFVIIPLTPIVLMLGLFTGGYYWSKEMKVYLFFGEIEAPLEKAEDENEGVSKDSSSQEELQEIKEELKRTQEELKRTQEKLMTSQEELKDELKKSHSEIIALLNNNK
jgi:hypothetical protein